MPRISLLTAVRDGLPHLEEAVASIRSQTLRDWEWVIVDDGSRDGTAAWLDDWARRERRIRVLHRPARGFVASLNEGLAHCRSALVARMDADDIALPERLAAQAAYLEAHPDIAAADTRVALLGGERNDGMRAYVAWVNAHPTPESIAADLFVESPLVHPAVCFQAEVVRAAGGYRDGDFPEDYDLWLRLYASGFRFGKLEPTLLLWRDDPRRLSRTDPRYHRSAFMRLKQHYLEHLDGDMLRGERFVLWGAAHRSRPWRRWLRRIGARPEFVVEVNPARIGRRILDAPVIGIGEAAQCAWRMMLVTVSGRVAREGIRDLLAAWGLADPGLAGPDSESDGRRVRYV